MKKRLSTIPPSPPRAWAEINTSALKENLAFIQKHSQEKVMAVLKAGAYGHGLTQIASVLASQPIDYLGVANVLEARKIESLGIRTPKIYLLGPTFSGERAEIVAHQWTPSLSSIEEAKEFCRLNKNNTPLEVHLTLDTGMGRGGFLPHEFDDIFAQINTMSELKVVGIGSHLPSADEDREFTQKQFQQFESIVSRYPLPYIHLSNSAGLLDYTSETTTMVRPGLSLYGISPLAKYQHQLTPVMTFKSRVSLVRKLPAGHGISYGGDTILKQNTQVATIGVGYGDGYPRALSHQDAEVIIQNQKCRILGRVTMDQIMVDVSHLDDCRSGDEVELFGTQILVSEIAQKANTIPWEILTGITPRVTRVYL